MSTPEEQAQTLVVKLQSSRELEMLIPENSVVLKSGNWLGQPGTTETGGYHPKKFILEPKA